MRSSTDVTQKADGKTSQGVGNGECSKSNGQGGYQSSPCIDLNHNIAGSHPKLKHSQSDRNFKYCLESPSLTSSSQAEKHALYHDTKLVVLHYLSTSFSSNSESLSPTNSLRFLASPIQSDSVFNDDHSRPWDTCSWHERSGRQRLRSRRRSRRRFHSSPAFSHTCWSLDISSSSFHEEQVPASDSGLQSHVTAGALSNISESKEQVGSCQIPSGSREDSLTTKTGACNCTDDSITMTPLTPHAGDRREMRRRSEQPYIPHYKMCKPKITIDIIAAQNYYYMENLTPPSEVEFDLLTPRERALKEIQTEVTRTLSVVSPTVGVVPPTPHTKVADFLQVIGRQYDRKISEAMQEAMREEKHQGVQYDQFVRLVDRVAQDLAPEVGWPQISLYMKLGSAMVGHIMNRGHAGVSYVADFTTQMIFDRAAGFLVANGGWANVGSHRKGSVANMSPSNALFTSSSGSSTSTSTSSGFNMTDSTGRVRSSLLHPSSASMGRPITPSTPGSGKLKLVASFPSLGMPISPVSEMNENCESAGAKNQNDDGQIIFTFSGTSFESRQSQLDSPKPHWVFENSDYEGQETMNNRLASAKSSKEEVNESSNQREENDSSSVNCCQQSIEVASPLLTPNRRSEYRMETRHSTDDWTVVYGGEAVCEQVDHGASESTQWVDSSCALSDGEGRDMSLFNRFRKSSKRSKSSTSISRPDVQTSPYSYSARRHRSTSSGNSLNSSHTGSSEDFPVLTPSPFGSLRDVDNCEAGDRTPSTSSYAAADTSSLSSVPSISCCGASTPQRLEHYNRHKKFESDRKTKKRIKDKPPKLTRSSATDGLESPNETSGLVLSSPNIADIESTTPTEAVQHILSTPVTSQPTCTYPECAAEQVDVLEQEDVVEQEDIVYTSADELHVHHSIPLISSITLSQQIISQHSLDPAQSADTSCPIFPAAFSSSSAETDPCVGSTFSEGTPSSSVEEDKITPVSVDKQKSAASDTFYFSCEEEFVTPETSFTSDQPSLTMPPISSASRPTSPATLPSTSTTLHNNSEVFQNSSPNVSTGSFSPPTTPPVPPTTSPVPPTTPAVPPTTPAVPSTTPPTSSVVYDSNSPTFSAGSVSPSTTPPVPPTTPPVPPTTPPVPPTTPPMSPTSSGELSTSSETAVPSQPLPIKEDTILPESHTSLSARDNVIGEAVIPPQTDSGNQIVEEAVLPESRATLSSSAPECSSFAPREICLPRLLPSPRVQKKSDKMADVTNEGPADSTHLRVSDNNEKEISADANSNVTPADASSSVTPADASSSVTPADANSSVTPADASSSVTPADASSSVTPADPSSSVTPADPSSSVTPADASSSVTPADASSSVTPAETSSRVTPAHTSSRVTPAETSSRVTPAIHMTPSSEVNLEAMATVLTNREYRLIASDSSEESDSDEEFLSPGTPVVSQINVSYPSADGTPSRAASTLDSISQTLYDNPVAVAAAGALTGIIIGVVLLLKYKKL